MTPEQYCRDKTRGAGSSFFYAFLFLPEDQRRAIMALYAFCREVDDVADTIREQEVALAKLAFWREEVARVFRDQPQHPVGKELCWAKGRFSLDEELLVELLDGMLMDISRKAIVTPADLSLYCYRVAGVVGLLSIEIFGYRQRKSRDFATRLGEALQLTNILRDVAEDARLGRIYIPQSDRARYQVADQAFIQGRCDEKMQQLLRHYAQRAETAYQQAVATLPMADRAALRPSIVMAAIYHAYLPRLEAVAFDLWRHPVRMLPLRKIWIAWRAWRYEIKACKKGLPVRLEF